MELFGAKFMEYLGSKFIKQVNRGAKITFGRESKIYYWIICEAYNARFSFIWVTNITKRQPAILYSDSIYSLTVI